ncbi:class I SAM-dependent DNA methyltransferase [Pseudomonas mediterranea]|uniref:class I SAM-dependent DNA methyltransferase n=1 Tax=Pseudomonas mediterranea TaxID=183795 RepID=UPI0006D89BA8|nr:class I SAM-dependent methyltransferase [Pseudomonas mediterranea]MDU9027641.1 class I SAM-dependent methyltransferase [Pseudomonas mediterranea]
MLAPDTLTLKYYDSVCDEYDKFSSSIDMQAQWEVFERKLPLGSKILDLGCGTGRDIQYFLSKGYNVEGLEPSVAMANIARLKTGAKIINLAAEQMDFAGEFDGVWACASLIHIPKSALVATLPKIARALKFGGYFYLSLKQGVGEARNNDGRFFSFYEMDEILELLLNVNQLEGVEHWLSKDLAGRSDTQWINVLVKKISM